jgi:hypothetical protein
MPGPSLDAKMYRCPVEQRFALSDRLSMSAPAQSTSPRSLEELGHRTSWTGDDA